jgi:hypothetical protein
MFRAARPRQSPPNGYPTDDHSLPARTLPPRRVSAIEHGAEQATRATLAAYVAALGGRLRLVAEFEDESLALS